MIEIGNDVVDLRDPDADPGTLHPRFDQKVFTGTEQAALAASARPTTLRWRLWAAKEAAYKAARKRNVETVFSPRRFVACAELAAGASRGLVRHGDDAYRLRVTEHDGAIHALALASAADPVSWLAAPVTPAPDRTVFERFDLGSLRLLTGLRRLASDDPARLAPEGPSDAVRRLARQHLAAALDCDEPDLVVRRRGRVPELWRAGVRAPADLSLAHHGAFVAFACALDAPAPALERCA